MDIGESKMKRKIGMRDYDKDVLISAPRKFKIFREGGFLMLSQDRVMEIISEKRYTGDTLRVFLFFIAVTEYDNRIKGYTQKKIAEKIKITQSKVSSAMKMLIDDGIIYKDEDTRDYYFAGDLLQKGTYKYVKKIQDEEQLSLEDNEE